MTKNGQKVTRTAHPAGLALPACGLAQAVNPRGGGLVSSLTLEFVLHAFFTPFTFLSLFLPRKSRQQRPPPAAAASYCSVWKVFAKAPQERNFFGFQKWALLCLFSWLWDLKVSKMNAEESDLPFGEVSAFNSLW